MDFILRCNSLKCRAQLTDHAVVTTCSHVFCINCSTSTGLLNTALNKRICPACETRLNNTDDIVATSLNPSEDYKTSVLSGLSPANIVECAGRGLNFYAYQATQEILYQEYISRSLTDKYTALNSRLDQIMYDANSEIAALRNKVTALQSEQESLRRKTKSLREAYDDKVRQHQKSQVTYDKLKKRLLESDVQFAAEDAIENALNVQTNGRPLQQPTTTAAHYPNTEWSHQRRKSGGSHGSGKYFRVRRESHASPFNQTIRLQPSELHNFPPKHRTRLPFENQVSGMGNEGTEHLHTLAGNASRGNYQGIASTHVLTQRVNSKR